MPAFIGLHFGANHNRIDAIFWSKLDLGKAESCAFVFAEKSEDILMF